MKKIALTLAIVLGLGLTTFANPNGGLFNRGTGVDNNNESSYTMNRPNGSPMLSGHGENTNQPAPLGSGIVLLTVLGGAYLASKKNREE